MDAEHRRLVINRADALKDCGRIRRRGQQACGRTSEPSAPAARNVDGWPAVGATLRSRCPSLLLAHPRSLIRTCVLVGLSARFDESRVGVDGGAPLLSHPPSGLLSHSTAPGSGRTAPIADHDIRSDIRSLRSTVERIDRDLTAHLRRDNDLDMRSAENNGRLQGRLDRIEASLANLGTLIMSLEAKLERCAGMADD